MPGNAFDWARDRDRRRGRASVQAQRDADAYARDLDRARRRRRVQPVLVQVHCAGCDRHAYVEVPPHRLDTARFRCTHCGSQAVSVVR